MPRHDALRPTFAPRRRKRILIKDGAYGTLIQAERLDEADYRGELALNHDQQRQ